MPANRFNTLHDKDGAFFIARRAQSVYKYRLFGYFLLMDEEWQRRRVAIGLDPYEA